jgi:hypothetical protein
VDGVGGLAPQFGRRLDANLPILDAQDRRLGRPAGDQDGIVAGVTHLGGEKTATVGIAIDASQGRLVGHVQAGPGGPGRAGQRPGGENEIVAGRQWLHAGAHPVEQQPGPQPPSPQELAEDFGRCLDDFDVGC